MRSNFSFHTVQLDAGVLPGRVLASRTGDDLELRIKGSADALLLRDFYLQPASWQAVPPPMSDEFKGCSALRGNY